MDRKILILSLLLAMLASAHKGPSTEIDEQWNDFKVKFGKSYEGETEEMFRKKIFAENLREIEVHNELYSEGLTSYTTGINQFHDMEEREFTEMMSCLNVTDVFANSTTTTFDPISKRLPTEIDWRERGYVTPVKDQLTFGSCWAFSAVGSLEALMARSTGKLVSLSEQNLVDCSSRYGNSGCNGGTPGRAFAYVLDNEGINTETAYPYEGNSSTCRYQPDAIGGTCDYFFAIFGEGNIKAVVATAGPVVVGMVASSSFKNYKEGIYDNETCLGRLNHTVLIVGYGTNSSSGEDYWIVKNSWGTTWGMGGYALVARNKLVCGIGLHATFPVVYNEPIDSTTTTTFVPTVIACESSIDTASLMTILLLQLSCVLFTRREVTLD